MANYFRMPDIRDMNTIQNPDGYYQYYHLSFIGSGSTYWRATTDLEYQTINGQLIVDADPVTDWWPLPDGIQDTRKYRSINWNNDGRNFVNNATDKMIIAIRANADNSDFNTHYLNTPSQRNKNSWKESNPIQALHIFGNIDSLSKNNTRGPDEANLYELICYNQRLSDTEMSNTIKYLNKNGLYMKPLLMILLGQ